ncbi:gliding motility protein GldF [Minicystis rosea]|nr:gliding motility protein GldF [Minicystis rosea]
MSTTLTIAKREFRSNFDSPLAYVVICLALVMLGAFFFFVNDYWQIDRATLASLFDLAPLGLSLVVIPVVTMRLLAEEKRSGTLEMLITLPVRDHEVILGKFLGAWALVLVLIATTTLYPIMMFKAPWHLGSLDSGPVLSGYLGLVLYSAAAVSIGLLLSALTESQVIAFFITWALLVFFSVLGRFARGFPRARRGTSSTSSASMRISRRSRAARSSRGTSSTSSRSRSAA